MKTFFSDIIQDFRALFNGDAIAIITIVVYNWYMIDVIDNNYIRMTHVLTIRIRL